MYSLGKGIESLDGILQFETQNASPETFNGVRVFTIFGDNPADAILRNLEYFNL